MASLEVKVLSPAKVVTSVMAHGVTVPGIEGYMTLLPTHAAIVSEMAIGELVIDQGSSQHHYFVSGGYVDVQNDKIMVLADVIESPDAIDVERATAAQKRAQNRLDGKAHETDMLRAQRALRRAEVRLGIAQVLGSIARTI